MIKFLVNIKVSSRLTLLFRTLSKARLKDTGVGNKCFTYYSFTYDSGSNFGGGNFETKRLKMTEKL